MVRRPCVLALALAPAHAARATPHVSRRIVLRRWPWCHVVRLLPFSLRTSTLLPPLNPATLPHTSRAVLHSPASAALRRLPGCRAGADVCRERPWASELARGACALRMQVRGVYMCVCVCARACSRVLFS